LGEAVRLFGLAAGIFAGFLAAPHSAALAQDQSTGLVFVSPEEASTFQSTPVFRAYLPEIADLSSSLPVPEDQGAQGSCVGWAVAYAARSYYVATREGRSIASTQNIPSPAYVYNSILDRSRGCDSGSKIFKALDLLKTGSASLADFPYTDQACPEPGAQSSLRLGFKIAGWQFVDFRTSLDQVKGQLASGDPVIVAMTPNADFDNLAGDAVWTAGPIEPDNLSGHAISIVGYDDRRGVFKFINSWGTDWGNHGFGEMTYETFRNRVREAYVMDPVADPTPPPPNPAPPPPDPTPPPPNPIPPPDPVPPPSPPPAPAPAPAYQCSSLRIEDVGGRRVATGFVGSQADLDDARARIGTAVDEFRVELRPWPQCEVLLTLDKQLADGNAPQIAINATDLTEGDPLQVSVTTPPFDAYIHIAYVQADGSVVTLQQAAAPTLLTHRANEHLVYGDGLEGRPKFSIAAPYGNEMIVVLASRSPLFSSPRPALETEREFLSALREALLRRPSATAAERFVSAGFVSLTTRAGAAPPKPEPEDIPCVETSDPAAYAC
jgi:hypothetical protein